MRRIICIIIFLFFTGINLQAQNGIQKLNDKVAFKTAVANNENVVIIFAAEWCGYCKDFLPKAEKITADYENVRFFKINYDENRALFRAENIEATPTVQLYKNGVKTDEMVIIKTAPLQEKLRSF